MPGTLPVRSRWMPTTPMPPSTLSILTVAVQSSLSGVKPAAPSTKLSFMVKQLACAAAISSSGLVPAFPSSFSKRVMKLCGMPSSAPLVLLMCPLPSLPVPLQVAVARLFSAMIRWWFAVERAR